MALQSVLPPFPYFTDADGSQLEDGFIYIGTSGLYAQTNQIAVYWDPELTQPAAQPLRTSGGFISRAGTAANVYTSAEDYSLLVQNKNQVVIFSALNNGTRIGGAEITSPTITTDNVSYNLPGSLTTRILTVKLEESVSVLDYGAKGDGVSTVADTVAFNAALASGYKTIRVPVPPVKYTIGSTLVIPDGVTLLGENRVSSIIEKDFNGSLMTLGEGSALMHLTLVGDGSAFTGTGVDIVSGKNNQLIFDCDFKLFNGYCLYIPKDGGANATINDCSFERYNSLAGTLYAIGFEDAIPASGFRHAMSFLACSSVGFSFEFGGATLVSIVGGNYGLPKFSANSSLIKYTATRFSGTTPVDVKGSVISGISSGFGCSTMTISGSISSFIDCVFAPTDTGQMVLSGDRNLIIGPIDQNARGWSISGDNNKIHGGNSGPVTTTSAAEGNRVNDVLLSSSAISLDGTANLLSGVRSGGITTILGTSNSISGGDVGAVTVSVGSGHRLSSVRVEGVLTIGATVTDFIESGCVIATLPIVNNATSGSVVIDQKSRTFTPTLLGGSSIGNGVLGGSYSINGSVCTFNAFIQVGSTTVIGAGLQFTLPVLPDLSISLRSFPLGLCLYRDDSSGTIYEGWFSGTNQSLTASARYEDGVVGSTSPFNWATNDEIQITGSYKIINSA